MLDTNQVAQQLGISRRSVVTLIKKGEFPNHIKHPTNRIGYRIPQTDVDAYVARNQNHDTGEQQ